MKRRAFVGKYANAQDPFDYAAQLCLRRSAQGDRVSFYVILRSRGRAARIEGSLKTKPSSILHFTLYILHSGKSLIRLRGGIARIPDKLQHNFVHYFFGAPLNCHKMYAIIVVRKTGGHMMTLGNRLAHLREKTGISQERLGELLGVTRQTVSSWETDKLLPKPENLRALCRHFHVGYEYFFPEGGDMQSKQMQELAAAVMALQGQVSALQEAQGEQQKAEAADQDPGKVAAKGRFRKAYIFFRSVALTVCAVLIVLIAVVLIGISYQSGEGVAGANVIVWNMPPWLIAVTVAFIVACVVGACIEAIVRSVHSNRKQEGRIAERKDKNRQ